MNYNFNYDKFRTLIFALGYKSEKNFFEETRTPKSTFQNIKNGSCDLSTVKRLCGILKCEITDLFPSDILFNAKNESYVLKVKKIAILSTMTNIGVTTFSVNLAQMLERRRYKTLIVEVGNSTNFDILELHNRNTKFIPTIIGDSVLKIKRHGPWLDSLRITDYKNDTSHKFNDQSGVNLELSNLEIMFEELVKKNHYVYIIFSCRGFPFHSLIEKRLDDMYGQEQLVKLADIALVGIETSRIKIERVKVLINWLCELKIEIFITEFMRKKKKWFTDTRDENGEDVTVFDKNNYDKYLTNQKEYFMILHDLAKQMKNVHIMEHFLTYFGRSDFQYLSKSIFTTEDSKLKVSLRNYKYQVKNLFDELDSFEREV